MRTLLVAGWVLLITTLPVCHAEQIAHIGQPAARAPLEVPPARLHAGP